MGMFDSIYVRYPLPLPLEVIDKLPDYIEIVFQTKNLENLLETYTLEEDGTLSFLRQERKWVDDDSYFLKGYLDVTKEETVPSNFHGIINFYCYERFEHSKESGEDITIDYEAKFIDGKLHSLSLTNFEIIDASDQIKSTNDFFKKISDSRKKWYYVYIFNTRPYRYVKGLITKGLYFIEKRISDIRMLIFRYL